MNEERRLALWGPYHVSRHVTDTVNGQLSEVQSNKSHISNPKLAKASKRVLLKPAQRGEGRVGALGVTDLGCKSITKVKNWPAKSVVRTPNSKQSYQRVECPSGSLGTASSAADRIVARDTTAKPTREIRGARRIFSRVNRKRLSVGSTTRSRSRVRMSRVLSGRLVAVGSSHRDRITVRSELYT